MFQILVSSAVLLLGGTASASVVVGHPVEFAGGAGLSITAGELFITTIEYDRCDDTRTTLSFYDTFDVAGDDLLPLPEGDTCGMRINLGQAVTLSGTGNGGTFGITVAPNYIHVEIATPITVYSDGTTTGSMVEIATQNWITATSLALSQGQHVTVGTAHPQHNAIRASLRGDSTAW